MYKSFDDPPIKVKDKNGRIGTVLKCKWVMIEWKHLRLFTVAFPNTTELLYESQVTMI